MVFFSLKVFSSRSWLGYGGREKDDVLIGTRKQKVWVSRVLSWGVLVFVLTLLDGKEPAWYFHFVVRNKKRHRLGKYEYMSPIVLD